MKSTQTAVFAGTFDLGGLMMQELTFNSAADLATQVARAQVNQFFQGSQLNNAMLMHNASAHQLEVFTSDFESCQCAEHELQKLNLLPECMPWVTQLMVGDTEQALEDATMPIAEMAKTLRALAEKLAPQEGQVLADGQIHLNVVAEFLERKAKVLQP